MNLFQIPLDIENVKIEGVEFTTNHEIVITVTSTFEGTHCQHCGKEIKNFYGFSREITLRHLSILGKPTFIHIKPKRYQCPYCSDHPTTTQKLAWYDPLSPHTRAYENHILLNLVNSTVMDVSIKEDLGYEAVMGIIDRHVSKEVNWNDFKELEIVGVDEIALKKGHKDYVTVVSTRSAEGDNRILAILKDREKATVKKFFSSIPKDLRKTIRVVCTDMYEGFVNAAKEVLGRKVKIVVDRFHVAKLYRQGLEDVRKKELKRLKQELPKEQYQEFKGAMWVLRKNPDSLESDEQEMLKKLIKHSPMLGVAYAHCYALTAIFEEPLTKSEARLRLRAWKALVQQSGLTCFDGFLKTLDEWMDEITHYFVDRHNSGFVEGLNNRIKMIKRRCYGILNIGHFFQRLFIDLRGYEEFS